MRHGTGKMTFANGDVWEGHFSIDWYNEGKFTLANGEEVKNYRIGIVYREDPVMTVWDLGGEYHGPVPNYVRSRRF